MTLKRHNNSPGPLSVSTGLSVFVIVILLANQGKTIINTNHFSSRSDYDVFHESQLKTRGCVPGRIYAALVMFGVPKSFRFIWRSYVRNIVDRNPHVDFEVHFHMYSDLTVVFTPRNSEVNASLDSPVTIKSILNSEGGHIPIYFSTSSQKEFDVSLVSWLGKNTLHDYDIHTTMNIFRQGNSMKKAFLSASRQEHLNFTSWGSGPCENSTIYIFLRSDTLLISPVDIPKQGLGGIDVYLPMWQAWPGRAYNDRFAVAGSYAAKIYASAKSVGFQQMILDQWDKNESLQMLGTPERMLKRHLDKYNLNITLLPDWAKLLRIRGEGGMNVRDVSEFGVTVNRVEELLFAWTPL